MLSQKLCIQGFYNPDIDAMVSDTVSVYLRNSASPYEVLDFAIGVVDSSGQGSFEFSNAVNGVDYYIQLEHRNSIETWSSSAQMFTSDILNYNFTTASAQAFGNNQKLVDPSPVKYGIFSGDVNQEGYIDLNDISSVFNDAGIFLTGYVVTAVNGDKVVDLSDLTLTFNNSNAFVSEMKP